MRNTFTSIEFLLFIVDKAKTVGETIFEVRLDCLCLFTTAVGLIETTGVSLAVKSVSVARTSKGTSHGCAKGSKSLLTSECGK